MPGSTVPPNPQTRRGKRAAETRKAILKSGLELFEKKGFDSVSVAEITRLAGVAKGSFYTHFDTKSDLIVAEFWLIDKYYEEYSRRNLPRYKSAEEKLLAFTRAQMRYVRDTVGNAKLKILYSNQTLESGSKKVITNKDRQWHKIIRAIIAEGQEAGEFRRDLDAERLTELFNRTTRGVFLDWCIGDAGFDLLEEGVAVMRDWALHALRC
ncbi:MAG: TetR/AcrR family transcriptional regulator [Spirochaetaceae bacterium]